MPCSTRATWWPWSRSPDKPRRRPSSYRGAMRTAVQDRGDDAETLVATELESAGWRVLARNVRIGRGELDIVAVDPGPPPELVIVEVRWRGRRDYGLAEECLDLR